MPLRGLNEEENSNALGDSDLIEAENIWFRGDTAGTRPGIEDETASEDYGTAISSSPTIQSGYEYRYAIDSGRKHVVVAGGKVYYEDGAEVTKGAGVTISSGADYVWTFAEHKDVLYMAGGANSDTVTSWNGSGDLTKVTFQRDTNADGVADTDIDAKYIYQKWNYGWLCGMRGTQADNNPMVVRYSQLNNMDSWPDANTIGGSSAIGGFDSFGDNYTTGFGSWTDNKGDWLIVLTRKCLYSVVQSPDPLMPFYIDSVIQNGCVHQNAYVSLGTDSGEAIYMSENGIHSLRQSQQHGMRADKFLSWPIRNTFKELRRNRLKMACGTYWPDEGVVLFLVTHGHASSTHNLILCLDVRNREELSAETARWTIWRPSTAINRIWTARCGTAYTTAPNRTFVYAGTSSLGRVCRFNPDSGSYSDRGTAYTTRLHTASRNFKTPDVEKSLGDVWINLQRGTGSSFVPVLNPVWDYGARIGKVIPFTMTLSGAKFGSSLFGTGVWGVRNASQHKHLYAVGCGCSIGWRLQTTGINEPYLLTSLAYQLSGIGEEGD